MTEQTYKRPTYDEWSIDNPINPDEDKGNYETIEDKHYAEYLSDCYHHRISENHSVVISNIGRIKKIAENKKFEWEDEEPTETCGIVYDFDEWLYPTDTYGNTYHRVAKNLIEYTTQLRHYFDGFLLVPVAMYKGQVIMAKSVKSNTLDMYEVVEFLKELKQNNKMIFLYEVEETTTDFIIRYGVLND